MYKVDPAVEAMHRVLGEHTVDDRAVKVAREALKPIQKWYDKNEPAMGWEHNSEMEELKSLIYPYEEPDDAQT